MAKELELNALELGAMIHAGDSVMWGKADAEPLPLTQALMAQRHAIGILKVHSLDRGVDHPPNQSISREEE